MTYDLLIEPWIPVQTPTGQTEHVGLLDLFRRAHELKALLPETPDIASGLYRMLLAILHRAYDGPRNLKKEWRAIWDHGRFDGDRIGPYLTKWRSRFDLWDSNHPFLQDPTIPLDPSEDADSVSRLFVERAQGNNPTLFDHTLDEERPVIDTATAARRLIGSQTMALGGRIAGAAASALANPFAASVTFIVLGDTLFHTLALNLLVYDGKQPIPSSAKDLPSWERDIAEAKSRGAEGYLDLVTWRPRRYRLVPGDGAGRTVAGVIAAGEADRFVAEEVRDPFAAYRVSESAGYLPLRMDPDRALWRDSFPFFAGDGDWGRTPANINQAGSLVVDGVIPRSQLLRVMAVGFATDKAKKRMGRSETLPIPAGLLADPGTVPMVQQALIRSDEVGKALRSSAFVAARSSLAAGERTPDTSEIGKLADSAGSQAVYWSRAGEAFPKLLLDLAAARPEAERNWNASLRVAAEDGFRCVEVKLGASSRGYKAVTLGRTALTRRLFEVLPIPERQEATP